MTMPRDPVTLVIRRRVRPGQEEAFEVLVSSISGLVAAWPGHMGTGVVRPVPGQRDYTVVVRFGDAVQAASWEASAERSAWLAQIAPLIEGGTSVEQQPGLEFWFTPAGSPTLVQPHRWKMALVTLLALYPTSLLLTLALSPVVGHWPLPLRSLLSGVLVVFGMTYLIMPGMTRAFAGWLKREKAT